MKTHLIAILFLLGFPRVCDADILFLKNHNEIHGNVIKVDEYRKMVEIQVVLEGELIGGSVSIKARDIYGVYFGEEYKHLQQRILTAKELERLEEDRLNREEDADYARSESKSRVANVNRADSESRARVTSLESKYKHERGLADKQHENRLDLLRVSKENYINPSIRIVDETKREE